MKTIFKILVILVVAVLVGGLLYGVVTATSSSSQSQQFVEGSSNGQLPPDDNFDRPDPDEAPSGIQFPVDSIKNLVIITVVGALYFNATKFLSKKKSISASV